MKPLVLLAAVGLAAAAVSWAPERVCGQTIASQSQSHSQATVSPSLQPSQATEAQSLSRGLVDEWKFNDNGGGIARDSVGKNNALLEPGDSWVQGIQGSAVHMNGGPESCVGLPPGIVSTLTDFTICTWVRVDINATWNRIFDFGSGTNVYMFLSPDSASNTVRFAITLASNPGEQIIENGAPLSTGVWHHVAVTLSHSLGTLYIDGKIAGVNPGMTVRPCDLGKSTPNYIGRSQWGQDPQCSGPWKTFASTTGR